MPYDIRVRSPYTTAAEDATVLTNWQTFLAALRAASNHKVDAGGSMIGGKLVTGDEASGPHLRQGDIW